MVEFNDQLLKEFAEKAEMSTTLERKRELGFLPLFFEFTKKRWHEFSHDETLIVKYFKRVLQAGVYQGMPEEDFNKQLESKYNMFKLLNEL